MRRIRWFLAPVAAVSLAAGAAVAGPQSSETTPVTAEFQANLVQQRERACDASHSTFRLKFEGTETSSDPRLAGDLEARVRSVVNTETGWGRTTGKVVVRDAATGHPKFHGRVVGVIEPDGGVEGFLEGRTVGRPHMRLFANFNATQSQQTGAITGEFGKDSQSGGSEDPALLTNACRGGHAKQGG
jgi:hypothetical protein